MFSRKTGMQMTINNDRNNKDNNGRKIYMSTESHITNNATADFLKKLFEQTNPGQKSFSIDDLHTADFTNAHITKTGSNEYYTVLIYSNGVKITIFNSDYENNRSDIWSRDILSVLRTYGIELDTSNYSPHA